MTQPKVELKAEDSGLTQAVFKHEATPAREEQPIGTEGVTRDKQASGATAAVAATAATAATVAAPSVAAAAATLSVAASTAGASGGMGRNETENTSLDQVTT